MTYCVYIYMYLFVHIFIYTLSTYMWHVLPLHSSFKSFIKTHKIHVCYFTYMKTIKKATKWIYMGQIYHTNHLHLPTFTLHLQIYQSPWDPSWDLYPTPPSPNAFAARQLRAGFGRRLGGPSGGSGDASLSSVVELGSQCPWRRIFRIFSWLVSFDGCGCGWWMVDGCWEIWGWVVCFFRW